MNARIVTTATLFAAFSGVLVARAADSQLLSLVMPDAKVLAGVNVDQAKGSPFGVYLLTQMQSSNTDMQALVALTGFDPTRDVHELLMATNAVATDKTPIGMVVARGNFDPSRIAVLATAGGAVTETVNGVTILEDPKQTAGIAFLDPTLVVAGDVASVKAAIVRPGTGQSLPTVVLGQVNQWSTTQDAWVLTTVSPSELASGAAIPVLPALGNLQPVLQMVQQLAGGVKFGNSVVLTVAVQADTAQNATQLSNTVQFLVNMAQMQAAQNAQLASLAKGLTVSAQGNTVKIALSMPQAQFQQLVQQSQKKVAPPPPCVAVSKSNFADVIEWPANRSLTVAAPNEALIGAVTVTERSSARGEVDR